MRIALIMIVCALLAACAAQSTVPTQGNVGTETKSQTAAALNVELGATYIGNGDYQLADKKLRKAMQQDPRSSSAHWTFALLHERLGQIQAAELYYKKALSLNPNDSRGQNNFGAFLCKTRPLFGGG